MKIISPPIIKGTTIHNEGIFMSVRIIQEGGDWRYDFRATGMDTANTIQKALFGSIDRYISWKTNENPESNPPRNPPFINRNESG